MEEVRVYLKEQEVLEKLNMLREAGISVRELLHKAILEYEFLEETNVELC